jgi:hypothetical protein
MEYAVGLGGLVIANAPQLVGFIMPPFVEVFNREVKTETQRFLVSVVACLFAAVLLHWNEIAYGTPEQVFSFAGVIFLESQATYRLYFKDSQLQYHVQKLVKSNRLDEWEEVPQSPSVSVE